jgi:hypothetical protein
MAESSITTPPTAATAAAAVPVPAPEPAPAPAAAAAAAPAPPAANGRVAGSEKASESSESMDDVSHVIKFLSLDSNGIIRGAAVE